MKKSTIFLIALAFIVLGVVLGYLMWPKELTNNGQPANTNQPSVNQPITNNPEPTATTTEAEIITSDIDTSDWQAYRNEEWGFEFRYPKKWRVNTDSAKNIILTSPNYIAVRNGSGDFLGEIYVSVINNDNELATAELFNSFDDTSRFWFKKFSYKKERLNGEVSAIIFNNLKEEGVDYTRDMILLSNRNYVLNFSYIFIKNDNIMMKNTFYNITKTIKFSEK